MKIRTVECTMIENSGGMFFFSMKRKMSASTYCYFRELHPECVGFSPHVAKYLNYCFIKTGFAGNKDYLKRTREYISWRKTNNEEKLPLPKLPEEIEETKRRAVILKTGTAKEKAILADVVKAEKGKDHSQSDVLRRKILQRKEEWKKTLEDARTRYRLWPRIGDLLDSYIEKNLPWSSGERIDELIDTLFNNNTERVLPSAGYMSPMFIIAMLGLHHRLLYLFAKATKLHDVNYSGVDEFFALNKKRILEKQKELYSIYKCTRSTDVDGKKNCPANICAEVKNVCKAKNCEINDTVYKEFSQSLEKFQLLLKECLIESFAGRIVPQYLFGVVLVGYWNAIVPIVFSGKFDDYLHRYMSQFYEDPIFGKGRPSYDKQFLEAEEFYTDNSDTVFPEHFQRYVYFPDIEEGYADCMETTVTNMCHVLLVSFDPLDKGKGNFRNIMENFPESGEGSLRPKLINYYEKMNEFVSSGASFMDVALEQKLSDMFADLVCDIPGVKYRKITSSKARELDATSDNICKVISYLFTSNIKNFNSFKRLSYNGQNVSAEIKTETSKIVKFVLTCSKGRSKNLKREFTIHIGKHGFMDNIGVASEGTLTTDVFDSICRKIRVGTGGGIETGQGFTDFLSGYTRDVYSKIESAQSLPEIWAPTKAINKSLYVFGLASYPYRDLVMSVSIDKGIDAEGIKILGLLPNVEKLEYTVSENFNPEGFEFPVFPNAKTIKCTFRGEYKKLQVFRGIWKTPKCTKFTIDVRKVPFLEEGVSKLQDLEYLAINADNLKGLPTDIKECKSLKTLKISVRILEGNVDLSSMKCDPKLTIVFENKSLIPEGIWNIPTITDIEISNPYHKYMNTSSYINFHNAKKICLKKIDVSLSKIDFSSVNELILTDVTMHFSEEILRGLSNLEILNVSGEITSSESFGDLPRLRKFIVRAMTSPIEIEEFPQSLKELECIDTYPMNEEREFPNGDLETVKLTNLDIEFLDWNFLTWKNLKSLNIFSCRNLRFTVNEFTNFPILENLQLKNCSLIRDLPNDFYTLVNLKEFVYIMESVRITGYDEEYDTSPVTRVMLDFSRFSKLEKLKYQNIQNFDISGLENCPLKDVTLINIAVFPEGLTRCPIEKLDVVSDIPGLYLPDDLFVPTLKDLRISGPGVYYIPDKFDMSPITKLSIVDVRKIQHAVFPTSILRMRSIKNIELLLNSFPIPENLRSSLPKGTIIEIEEDETLFN